MQSIFKLVWSQFLDGRWTINDLVRCSQWFGWALSVKLVVLHASSGSFNFSPYSINWSLKQVPKKQKTRAIRRKTVPEIAERMSSKSRVYLCSSPYFELKMYLKSYKILSTTNSSTSFKFLNNTKFCMILKNYWLYNKRF